MPDSPDTAQSIQSATLVGTGGMATVCALLLDSLGHRVTMLGRSPARVAELVQLRVNAKYLPGVAIPESIRFTADPADAFPPTTDFAVNCIPTQSIREVWTPLAAHLPPATPVGSVAKGIETDTLLRPTQALADTLARASDTHRDRPPAVATLSGPTIADELAKRLPATLVAASTDPAFAAQLQAAFNCDWFRVYTNHDLLGVELAGATKNVIALAAGILDGLNAGINAKSALLARGLAEIERLGLALGAQRETFYGIAGVGDLATTCFSPSGRNRSCGELLGKGLPLADAIEQVQGVVEGVQTTKAVAQLAEQHNVEMPITQTIQRVLFDQLDPLQGISELMARDPKPERHTP